MQMQIVVISVCLSLFPLPNDFQSFDRLSVKACTVVSLHSMFDKCLEMETADC